VLLLFPCASTRRIRRGGKLPVHILSERLPSKTARLLFGHSLRTTEKHPRRARRGPVRPQRQTPKSTTLRWTILFATMEGRSTSSQGCAGHVFQRGEAKMAPVDLRELLLEVARIVNGDAKRKAILWSLEVPDSLPSVRGDKIHLTQAVLNLVLNAFDSGCDCQGPRKVTLCARLGAPGEMHISVRDSGKGIHPTVMPRLFEPYFTTKPTGMGMELTIVRSIIEKSRWPDLGNAESRPWGRHWSSFYRLNQADASDPRHRDSVHLCPLENRSRVSLPVVPIPERMPDVVAAFDLDGRISLAIEPNQWRRDWPDDTELEETCLMLELMSSRRQDRSLRMRGGSIA